VKKMILGLVANAGREAEELILNVVSEKVKGERLRER
jgi:hypothetical protein